MQVGGAYKMRLQQLFFKSSQTVIYIKRVPEDIQSDTSSTRSINLLTAANEISITSE